MLKLLEITVHLIKHFKALLLAMYKKWQGSYKLFSEMQYCM